MEPKLNKYRIALKWILILAGMFLMLAFAAVLLPVPTMATIHRWLGLGDFPVQPITIYLARSTSLLYGIHGVLMFYTGCTLDHHWRLVWFFGWLHVVIGIVILAVDLLAPMPWYWTCLEGPPVAVLGGLILYLAEKSLDGQARQSFT